MVLLGFFGCRSSERRYSHDSFEFTPRHEVLLRRQVSGWSPSENGAAGMLPDKGNAYSEGLLPAFEIWLRFGELSPGAYRFANPWVRRGLSSWQINADSETTMAIPQEAEVEFRFTAEHARLLKRATLRGGVIDSKRPYGDMTCFYLDMAEILGESPKMGGDSCESRFTQEQLGRFDELHRSMPQALQAFLLYAKAPTGTYRRRPAAHGSWIRE